MCGIAGMFDLMGDRPVDPAILRRMTGALAHRGPDGEGFHFEPGVGLGHRRLAIIDRAGGAQPFHASSGAHAVVFNGEIYNHRELARTLVDEGVVLRTRSDTEVLTEGLARKGDAFIDALRGMFAFALWDRTQRRVLLARDRLGEKPLYYAVTDDGWLVFASEIGAVLASGHVAPDLDREAVADYLLLGYVPDPKSIIAGVRKLAPGSILEARAGGDIAVRRYWRPVFAPDPSITFDAAVENLRERLDDTVRLLMTADVPLGAFLSGGVDSAAVVSSMASAGADVDTVTVGFRGGNDERPQARAIAERFGVRSHALEADLDALRLIDRIAGAFGEPFADTSALPTFLVCEAARRYVTVALSGDGGDEVFAGYRRYPLFLAEERLRGAIPMPLRRAAFGAAGALYPKLDWAPRPLRLKTTLQSLGETRASAYARAAALNLPDRIASITSTDFRAGLDGYRPQSVFETHFDDAAGLDPLSAAQHVDLATWLPGRMLVKIDRAAMANGLEVRPPLLDHHLVEWAGSLAPTFKLSRGVGKRVLKAALRPRLPADTLDRRKRGFEAPARSWLRNPAGPSQRLRDSAAWRGSGVFDERRVFSMMAAHEAGRSDFSQEIWTVVMFDAFLRQPMISGGRGADAGSRP